MFPDPIFEIAGRGIYLYGVCIAIGLLCCLIAFFSLSKKMGMPNAVQDYVFFILIGGLASGFFFAMLFQAFYNWIAGKGFDLFGGGLTVMGGLVGGVGMFLLLYFLIGKFYFRNEKKGWHVKFFNILYRVAPICIVIAHGFGRLGCLSSGCCHGQYLGRNYVFGGIWMYGTVDNVRLWGYYVPTQLYEALFLFTLAVIMTILLFKRCNINMSIYVIAYGVWRFVIEYFRSDYRGALVPGLTPSQWMSIAFVLVGGVLIVLHVWKKWPIFLKNKEKDTTVQTDKSE